MKLAIMQPYFFPYIGYFQLMNAVDTFVVYDNIQYVKQTWINRNRILLNNADSYITLPLKKDSDYLDIKDRFLADSFLQEREKTLRKIEAAYKKAPYYREVFPIVEKCMMRDEKNLFSFLYHSILVLRDHFKIPTSIVISSTINADHLLKGEQRVIAICKAVSTQHYINAIGGRELYSKEAFAENGINLSFLQTDTLSYTQYGNQFVPQLSIIDVMMFNSVETIRDFFSLYKLV